MFTKDSLDRTDTTTLLASINGRDGRAIKCRFECPLTRPLFVAAGLRTFVDLVNIAQKRDPRRTHVNDHRENLSDDSLSVDKVRCRAIVSPCLSSIQIGHDIKPEFVICAEARHSRRILKRGIFLGYSDYDRVTLFKFVIHFLQLNQLPPAVRSPRRSIRSDNDILLAKKTAYGNVAAAIHSWQTEARRAIANIQ